MTSSMKGTLFLLLCAVSTDALSQESRQPWDEYDKRIKSAQEVTALGSDLFGESISLANGALSFSVTDVSVPGNDKLPVAFTRTLTVSNRKGYVRNDLPLGDWDLDVPRISGVFQAGGNSFGTPCTATTPVQGRPPAATVSGGTFQPYEYWGGNQADMPNGGEMLLVNSNAPAPSAGGPYYWMTSGFTYFSCLSSIKNGTGEGFLAVAPDGTRYWFDWLAQYGEPEMDQVVAWASAESITGPWTAEATLHRSRKVLYATRVEDRFGNFVTYTYSNTAANPAMLTSINASDGRSITIGYNPQGQVSTVSNGSQAPWTYAYDYSDPARASLNGVVLPDASRWSLSLAAVTSNAIRYSRGQSGDPVRSCGDPGDVISGASTGTITHPSGAVGEFTVEPVRHGRSNVPMVCSGYTTPYNNSNDDVAYYALNYDALSLTRKRISGPGLSIAEWNYAYAANIYFAPGTGPVCLSGDCMAPPCLSDTCAGSSWTYVWGPNDQYIRYTFGNSYRYNEGKLLKVETGTGVPLNLAATPTLLRIENTAYELAQSAQPFQTPIGTSPKERGEGFPSEYLRPQVSRTIQQDGVTFSSQVALGCTASGVRCFDTFGRPTKVTKSSSLGYNRTDVTAYYDNLSNWVLGQMATVTNTDTTPNVVVGKTEYDTNAMPWKVYGAGTSSTPGILQQTLSYDTTSAVTTGQRGTLISVKDGNNNVTTLSNWKRGVPQTIQHPATPEKPAGATESAVVNDNGWILSTTNENGSGYTINYGYDAMGRLASVVYPSGDSTVWNTTTRSFVPVATTEYGLPLGHWKQTVQTGTGLTTTFYDAQWRPVLTLTEDTTNGATKSFVVNRYDSLGRLVFTSYPVTSLTTINDALTGVTTTYDPLDRVKQVKQDSELGTLTTTTEYLTGFQTRVTDPRLHQTTTSYQVFDAPSTDAPTTIAAPGGVTTTITRDVFGKPLTVTRTGPGG